MSGEQPGAGAPQTQPEPQPEPPAERPRSRRRRRTPWYKRVLRAWKYWVPVLAVLVMAAGGGVFLAQGVSEYTAPRMAGPMLVTARNDTAAVIFLTTHQETRSTRWRMLLGGEADVPLLHWDVWSFDGRDLRQRWVTRLASVRRGRHDPDRGVLGAEGGAVWVLADRLYLISQNGGRIMGDAAMIEARNREMRSRFPNSRRELEFDSGLVVTAASGAKFRVDPRGLNARPIANAARATDSITPARLLEGDSGAKLRGVAEERSWVGLARAGEMGQRDAVPPGERDFPAGARNRLVSGELYEGRDAAGQPARLLRTGLAAVPQSPEFLRGGLLALEIGPGQPRPITMSGPTRVLVLHDGADGGQVLSCLGMDGRECWRAATGLRGVRSGAPMGEGAPASWSVLLAGPALARGPRMGDEPDTLARVSLVDGSVQRLSIGALPVAGLRQVGDR